MPLYTNLLALEDEHGIAIGVINVPALGETVYAGRGLGCFCNGDRPASASARDSTGPTSSTSGFALVRRRCSARHAGRLKLRTWGDGYGYVLVATGRMEAMVDPVAALLRPGADAGDPRRGRRSRSPTSRAGPGRAAAAAWPPTASSTTSCSSCCAGPRPHPSRGALPVAGRAAGEVAPSEPLPRRGALVDEVAPSPRHPRTDGAHLAAADLGGLGVGEAQKLGQHEGLAPVGLELATRWSMTAGTGRAGSALGGSAGRACYSTRE